jgi:hypothetical protein
LLKLLIVHSLNCKLDVMDHVLEEARLLIIEALQLPERIFYLVNWHVSADHRLNELQCPLVIEGVRCGCGGFGCRLLVISAGYSDRYETQRCPKVCFKKTHTHKSDFQINFLYLFLLPLLLFWDCSILIIFFRIEIWRHIGDRRCVNIPRCSIRNGRPDWRHGFESVILLFIIRNLTFSLAI